MLVVFDVQCGGVEDLNQLLHHVAVGHVGIKAVVVMYAARVSFLSSRRKSSPICHGRSASLNSSPSPTRPAGSGMAVESLIVLPSFWYSDLLYVFNATTESRACSETHIGPKVAQFSGRCPR